MATKLGVAGVSGLLGIALCLTSCAGSADEAAPPSAGSSYSLAVQPADAGQTLIDLLNSATTSIDIVIYQIGDQNIQNALLNAMKRGVNVRVVIDGSSSGNQTDGTNFVAAMSGAPAGLFSAKWSSNNFNITHQKTVLIDAADSKGATLPAGSMPASARVMISTGNFFTYTNAAKNVNDPFYAARDFYLPSPDQNLINQVSTIFNSDFACAGNTVTNNLATAPAPLLWSNGATGMYAADPPGAYPTLQEGYFSSAPAGKWTVQGNVLDEQFDLIESAGQGDVVRIYNEEYSYSSLITAIKKAATPVAQGGQGADVRVVMSFAASDGKAESFVTSLEQLAAAGGRVTLMAPQSLYPDALYIHAKMITVTKPDGTISGFAGSQNFSYPSLAYNRELGTQLGANDQQVLQTMNSTFDSDFNQANLATQLTPSNSTNIPAAWLATPSTAAVVRPIPSDKAWGNRPACGPITAPAPAKK